MNRRPPDVCKHVFVCAFGDWQVQAAPRARSDLGGAVATFYEAADAHRVHIFAEHTEAQREAMRSHLQRIQAPEEITRRRGGDSAAAFLVAVALPRWWVDR
jgi:hypothetical protein